MFLTYVLHSPSHDRSYIGQTDNLDTRLSRHNAGLVRSTKAFRPWELLHIEKYSSRAEAMRRERELKSHKGRDWIRTELLSGRVRPGNGPALDGQRPD
ncbi:MAG: GIY-YIG nuclease family protein [Candidatus Neomarinimicrobiota bacterium]